MHLQFEKLTYKLLIKQRGTEYHNNKNSLENIFNTYMYLYIILPHREKRPKNARSIKHTSKIMI